MLRRITAYVACVASGVALNAILYALGVLTGAFGQTVIAKANQQPLSLTPVILASVSAALAATLIRMILGLLVRPWSRAQKVWQTISIVALLLSFGSPMQGLAGHSALTIVILWVMHVVSAVSIYLALCWLTRPDWKFGTDWSPSVSYGGHLAVVTGATSGIGRAVAQQLHDLGFQVIGIGRTAKFPSAEFESSDRYHLVTTDLSTVQGAIQASRSIANIDSRPVRVLVHCAGTLKSTARQTEDGIDENFATSFLGRFALTSGLQTDADTRFVIVGAAESGRLSRRLLTPIDSSESVGGGLRAHGRAQLANDLWSARLARLGYRAYGYGPGSVATNIRREVPKPIERLLGVFFAPLTRPPSEAAADIVRLMLDESLPGSGFASRDGIFKHHPFIYSATNQELLFKFALDLVSKEVEAS